MSFIIYIAPMVEIEYQPVKKIVVHEILKSDYNDFINQFVIPLQPNMPSLDLRWVNGVLFFFQGFQDTPEIIHDRIQGIIHWEACNFTEMPKYQPMLTNTNTNASVKVTDNSHNTAVSDFIRWLKTQSQWFPSSGT